MLHITNWRTETVKLTTKGNVLKVKTEHLLDLIKQSILSRSPNSVNALQVEIELRAWLFLSKIMGQLENALQRNYQTTPVFLEFPNVLYFLRLDRISKMVWCTQALAGYTHKLESVLKLAVISLLKITNMKNLFRILFRKILFLNTKSQ